MRVSCKTYTLWLVGLMCLLCPSSMMGDKHELKVFVNPKDCRLFYKPSDGYLQEAYKDYEENHFDFEVEEGDSIFFEVYCRRGSYRFSGWQSEDRKWDEEEITFVMGDHDMELMAEFIFDPANIGSPVTNYFDAQTGTLYIDDFAPGTLSRNIERNVEYEDYEKVKTIKIYGEIKDDDLSIKNSYTLKRDFSNLETVDFTNTYGATTVPGGCIYGIGKLDRLILPAAIDNIGERAFYGCPSLKAIELNSLVPPNTAEGYFDSFNGLSEDVAFYVPAQSFSSYMLDPNWNTRIILPKNDNVANLILVFPTDWTDEMVKSCVIEVVTKHTGQSFRMMADKFECKVSNLCSTTEYEIKITTPSGFVLGEIELPSMDDGDNIIQLADLKKPSSLITKVYDEKGSDVTDGVNIVWYEGENILGRSSSIKDLVVGLNVRGIISLNKVLGKNYSVPEEIHYTVSHATADTVRVALSPMSRKELALKVIAKNTLSPIYDAAVSISQHTDSEDVISEVCHSDRQGCLSISRLEDKDGSIMISASGYQTISFPLSDIADDGEIALTPIRGSRLYIYKDYISAEYPDSLMRNSYDVAYRLVGENLPGYSVMSDEINFYEYLQPGYSFKVTAYSPEGKFDDIVNDVVVEEDCNAYLSLQLIENGGIDIFVEATNSIGMVMLYDAQGDLKGTAPINEDKAEFRNLKSGEYTAVSIEVNPRYNNYSSLEALRHSRLSEGTDYRISSISVNAGRITQQNVGTLLHLTPSEDNLITEDSYVVTDKPLYSVKDYITVKAKYVVEEGFEDQVADSRFAFYIPDGCEFIQNTVSSNQASKAYYIDGRVLYVNAESDEVIKFCIKPQTAGTYEISAQAFLNGEFGERIEAITTTRFMVPLFSLNVPPMVDNDVVSLNGKGPRKGKVSIYDDGQFVGTTLCDGMGTWVAEVPLVKPNSYSVHEISANIEDVEGQIHETEKKLVVHDVNSPILKSTSLIYHGNTVTFNHENQTVSPSYYTYKGQLGYYDYTFIGHWSKGDDTTIHNADFVVTCQNGSIVRIPAQWDAEKRAFVASREFTYDGTFIVPKFVTMEATIDKQGVIPDISKQLDDYNYKIEAALDDLKQSMIISNIQQDVSETKISFDYQSYEGGDVSNFEVMSISSEYLEETYPDATFWSDSDRKIVFDCSENGMSLDMYIWNPTEQEGILVSSSSKNDTMSNRKKIPLPTAFSVIVAVIKNIITNLDFSKDPLENIAEVERKSLEERYALISDIINSKDACGRYNISDPWLRARLKTEAEVNYSVRSELIDDLNRIITDSKEISWITTYFQIVYDAFTLPKDFIDVNVDKVIEELESVIGGSIRGGVLDFMSESYVKEAYWEEANENDDEYESIMKKIKGSIDGDCDIPLPPGDGNKDDDIHPNSAQVILDPSGYVYEGEPENRVENVKATVYYQEDGVEKVWDAENYGQVNPLYTDKEGRYEWYVPEGLWQVKFEKDGYQNTQSEWLPVPPPQMDVNVEILSMAAPLVSDANAYTKRVIVAFDRYVDSDAVVEDETVFITLDGKRIPGEWVAGTEGDFSRKFIFYPKKTIESDTVVLNVSGTLRSKAGVMVGADFMRELKVEDEITSIDLSEIIRIPYGEADHIEVRFEPANTANGKWMHIEVESEEIVKPFIKDVLIENGKAVVSLYGNIPGASNLKITVDGSYTQAESYVEVVGMTYEQTPMPTSSQPDMSVITPETDIRLFCADKNAVIRYTVDGTDPLSSATSVDYVRNEAIHLTQNTVLKAVAVSEERGASETAVFNYIISTFAVDEIMAKDFPIRYNDGTVSCEGAKRIVIFNLDGRIVIEENVQELNMNKLSRGIYIATAYTERGLSVIKIRK